ncbi:hypothetical protein HPP92_011422 [Vanilla planifolia]|uniref:Uncharacterized protein n=1 Tax=Vanilla planifolia TaxID=51239 RepID=A0A835UYF5_VANPL|nr:hypothetical protein HPP92_011422 [Vanilla planifolia]
MTYNHKGGHYNYDSSRRLLHEPLRLIVASRDVFVEMKSSFPWLHLKVETFIISRCWDLQILGYKAFQLIAFEHVCGSSRTTLDRGLKIGLRVLVA